MNEPTPPPLPEVIAPLRRAAPHPRQRPWWKRYEWASIFGGFVLGAVLSPLLLAGLAGGLRATDPLIEPETALMASSLWSKYRYDAEAAGRRYTGRRFAIYGTVKREDDGRRTLYLADSTRLNYAARCEMQAGQADRLKLLGFHSLVEIRGTCRGRADADDFAEVVFEDCELVHLTTGQDSFAR